MGTISDKLAELKNTKNDINLALREKHGNPTEVFSTYADIIRGFDVILSRNATMGGSIRVTNGSCMASLHPAYVSGTNLIYMIVLDGGYGSPSGSGTVSGTLNIAIPISPKQ